MVSGTKKTIVKRKAPVKSASKATEGPWLLTNKEFAEITGITHRRVNMLVKDGILQKHVSGKITADQVRRYMDYQIETALAKVRKEDDPLELERLRKIKLQNDETESQLIKVQEAVEAISMIFGPIQSEISSIPARVTNDLELRKLFEIETDISFNNLAKRYKEIGSALRSGRNFISETEEDNTVDLGQ